MTRSPSPEWPVARAAALVTVAAAAGTWLLALTSSPLLAPALLAAGPAIAVALGHGLVTGRQAETAFGVGGVVLVAAAGASVGPVAGGWALALGVGAWIVVAASATSLVTRVEHIDPRVLRSLLGSLAGTGFAGLAAGGIAVAFAGELPERTIALEAVGVVVVVAAIGLATARLIAPRPSGSGR